jgi:hypothetical protein
MYNIVEDEKKMYNVRSRQYCHYFNQDLNCPFDEFDCKFLHMISAQCKFGQFCTTKLCSYGHEKINLMSLNTKNEKIYNSNDTSEETKVYSFCTSTLNSEFD